MEGHPAAAYNLHLEAGSKTPYSGSGREKGTGLIGAYILLSPHRDLVQQVSPSHLQLHLELEITEP